MGIVVEVQQSPFSTASIRCRVLGTLNPKTLQAHFGFRVPGFKLQGLGFRGFRFSCTSCRHQAWLGSRFRFRVWGFWGFRCRDFEIETLTRPLGTFLHLPLLGLGGCTRTWSRPLFPFIRVGDPL